MEDKEIKDLCVGIVSQAVKDWKELCRLNLKSLKSCNEPVYEDNSKGVHISFQELAVFFLKDENGILAMLDINGYKILDQLLKIEGAPDIMVFKMPKNSLYNTNYSDKVEHYWKNVKLG